MRVEILDFLKNSTQFYVIVTDLDGRISFLNEAYKSKFLALENPINKELLESLYFDDIEEFNKAKFECISNPEKIVKVNMKKSFQNGKLILTEWEFSLYKEDGKAKGILAIGQDISEKIQLELDLKESEQRRLLEIETSLDGIIEWDIGQNTCIFSNIWKTDLGYPIDTNFSEIKDFLNKLETKSHLKINSILDSLRKGKINSFQEEIRIKDINSNFRTFILKGKSFSVNENNTPKNIFLRFTDRTQILDFEIERKKSLDLMRKQYKKIKQVTHLNAYELRAPLTNILGIIEIFKDKKMQKENLDYYIDYLDASAIKMDNINKHLNSLLQSSEIEIDSGLLINILKVVPKKIYLIDDDAIQNIVNEKLIHENNPEHTIRVFTNPNEAIHEIITNKNEIDLIFLDLNMPEIDGWEFIKLIEKEKIEIEIQILTSSIDKTDYIKANLYPNVKGIINKPLKKDLLINILS